MKREQPTPAELRELLDYDAETGALTWRDRSKTIIGRPKGFNKFNGRNAGRPALNSINPHGYYRGTVMYVNVMAHRAAWAIYYGEAPVGFIDHINRARTDNRISNLRLASRGQNAWNNGGRECTSVFKGVSRLKNGKWHARVSAGGTVYFAGDFDCEIAAALAHDDLAARVHGEFAWLNADHHTILSRGRA